MKTKPISTRHWTALAGAVWLAAGLALALAAPEEGSGPPIAVSNATMTETNKLPQPNWIDQSQAEADRKSRGCLECHTGVEPMHASKSVVLGCTDCHGGNPTPGLKQTQAHVAPRNPVFWQSSANPSDSSVLLNHESPEFIRFVNPGDLRVADTTCGPCHNQIVHNVGHSMMRHGAMLWGAALYNNGAYPAKNYRYGQAYGRDGEPLRLNSPIPVTATMTDKYGILPLIDPLPRFALSQPSNILRIFERGGEEQLSLGSPDPFEEDGHPERRLSDRGLGTLLRTDPVYLNLQKSRLNDPLLDFMGSNNHPGDYRSSGCSACHVVYANDRSPTDSGWYAKYGNQGLSFTADKAIRKDERGHPIKHQFTRAIPTSQCMTCHMHQGNLFVNPYLGYIWWDEETDGEFMYPAKQKNVTPVDLVNSVRNNPEAAAARGMWGDLDFLEKVSELNPQLTNTQFADYHGHGWVFRAVFKHDRLGNLRDRDDNVISFDDTNKFAKAVHLKDEHLAHGMQCADCHFDVDSHGNGLLYGEPRAATTIECIDCHGTIEKRPTLITSGNGGIWNGASITNVDLRADNTPWGPRFFWQGNKLYQRSTMTPDLIWEVPQTIDTIDPTSSHYNPASAYAKTIQRDGSTWGAVPKSNCPRNLAHDNSNVSCQICHSSWATSCFGCHLPMRANQRVPSNKFEGTTTRNFTSYNPQVIRDDVFQLGIDADYKHNRLAVLRSSSAVIVSSQNANREWVYSQQQTISAEGYSGQAYNPHLPHTTSGIGTTKNCEDCHVSKSNDNNAWMTSLLGFGTGTVNFFGRYAYVGEGKGGMDAVIWTEQDEPQAAIGSHLHRLAYPDNYKKHVEENHGILQDADHKEANDVQDLQQRGEYLYTANGSDGFRVFDVANIDQKGFSERISTAPVSPLGQRTYIHTKYATSVTLPSTLGVDPLRSRDPANKEQAVSPLYAWVFVTDREEGLVMVTVGTLLDGNPDNNFFDTGKEKVIRFNPDGKLTGAMHSFMAGTNLYVVGTNGLCVVGLRNDALEAPMLVSELHDGLQNPRAVGVQFRYAFVTDDEGFKVLDITDPTRPKLIPGAFVPLKHAHRFYIARTYAYVADGEDGLAFIDITNPEKPKLERLYNADGKLNDTRSVEIGSVSASEFALVADGKNGLQVLQLISPENVPGHMGFSPVSNPKLIASYPTATPALAISRGLDRDRVVDESGNQTVVFGRRGSRPFTLDEMKKLYEHDGSLYTVENVYNRNGKLVTQAGEEVKADGKFEPEETAATAPAPYDVRLSAPRRMKKSETMQTELALPEPNPTQGQARRGVYAASPSERRVAPALISNAHNQTTMCRATDGLSEKWSLGGWCLEFLWSLVFGAWFFSTKTNLVVLFSLGGMLLLLSLPSHAQDSVVTLAGVPQVSGPTNGTGTNALFGDPSAIVTDGSGNFYVADSANHAIRKVTTNGVVTTFAGKLGVYGSANGTGTGAQFYLPNGLAIDKSGNLYVGDTGNNLIRKITTSAAVSTFAGAGGDPGFLDGASGSALFSSPLGIAIWTNGNIFVADGGNHCIREIVNGTVSTFAGTPQIWGSADGTGTNAQFNGPCGLAFDTNGNLFVSDANNDTIRKITTNRIVTTYAGLAGTDGTADGSLTNARFRSPAELVFDQKGNLFVADSYNQTIREIGTNGIVTTVSGNPGVTGPQDGTNGTARFYNPYGLTIARDGSLVVADAYNETVRDVLVPFKLSMQIVNATHITTLTWNTVIGKKYQPQYQTDLTAPWLNLGSVTNAATLTTSTTDTYTSGPRFYRILQVN